MLGPVDLQLEFVSKGHANIAYDSLQHSYFCQKVWRDTSAKMGINLMHHLPSTKTCQQLGRAAFACAGRGVVFA